MAAKSSKANAKNSLIDNVADLIDSSGIDLGTAFELVSSATSSTSKKSGSTKKKSSKSDSIVTKLLGDDTVYPQFSEKTYWAIRGKFQKSIPEKVIASTLTNATGLKADTIKSSVLPAMESMGLIKDGKPTTKLKNWANDAKYEDTCLAVCEALYPAGLRKLDYGTKTAQNGILSWFKKNANVSEATAKKMMAIYLLLRDPKLKTSNAEKKAASTTKKTTSTTTTTKKTTPTAVVDSVKVTTKSGKSTITVKIVADEGITKKALTDKFTAAAAEAFSQMK